MSTPHAARSIGLACLIALAGVDAMSQPATGEVTTATAAVPSYHIAPVLPPDIRALVSEGRLNEAMQALEKQASASPEKWPRQELDRMRWLKRDFSLSAEQMLAKLREQIPGTTAADLEAWTASREIQWLKLDGEIRYFRREPANLFRFSESARQKRDAAKQGAPSGPAGDPSAGGTTVSALDRHIAAVVELAKTTESPVLKPSDYRIRHTIRVKPRTAPAGQTIRCWMPLPREYRQQSAARELVTVPPQHTVSAADAVHNTVYMELPSAGDAETVFSAEYRYINHAYVPRLTTATIDSVRNQPDADVSAYLREEPPHIMLSPDVRQLAADIVGNEKNPIRKAERIFRWMDANIRYCAEMEYATLANITEKIMQERRGDCGVQAILFVSLCRAAGVPARWQSGWVTQPGRWNMHDWAEFYAEPFSWLPADPSIGFRKSDDVEVREFLFGHVDAYRMIANSGICGEFDPPKRHVRSDPVDSQRGEVEWNGGNFTFDQWEYKVEILEHDEK
jgi:transglutaminase-like putative cysteine protease